LRDIERLLKREISKVTLEGFQPDPNIQAEPIKRRRMNAKGRSQPRKQTGNQGRDRSSAKKAADAWRESRSNRPEEKRASQKKKTAHKLVRRKSSDTQEKSHHRRDPHSGKGRERAALLGGLRDD